MSLVSPVSPTTGVLANRVLPESALYNKRQFWPYRRFHSKGQSHGRKTTKQNIEFKTSKTNNGKLKKTKIFHLVNNKIATDHDLIKRLDAIYIPPAYTNVVIAKSTNNKIQAIGTDTRGRRQYIYNPAFIKRRNDRKYDDILELAKKITAIEADNHAMLQSLGRKLVSEWQLPTRFHTRDSVYVANLSFSYW